MSTTAVQEQQTNVLIVTVEAVKSKGLKLFRHQPAGTHIVMPAVVLQEIHDHRHEVSKFNQVLEYLDKKFARYGGAWRGCQWCSSLHATELNGVHLNVQYGTPEILAELMHGQLVAA